MTPAHSAPVHVALPTGPAEAATGPAPFADLLRVLVQPWRTLARPRGGADAAGLLLALLAIDFLLSLLLLPSFVGELKTLFAAHPEMAGSAKVGSVAFALILSTTINALLIIVMTTLFLLALLIWNGKANPARLFSAVLLASAPLIVDRLLRVAASYVLPGRSSGDQLLPVGLLLPVEPGTGLHQALAYFSLFDLWTFVLVFIGVRSASGLKTLPALVMVVILWGALQGLLLQLHRAGFLA